MNFVKKIHCIDCLYPPGDATPTNAGRIHFVKKGFEGTTEYEWDNGIQDRNFRGAFDSNEPITQTK